MRGRSLERVLVFSRTTGYRHESVEAGVGCISQLGREHGFHVDATEDPSQFNDESLSAYDVVVWMQVSGTVLDEEQRKAYARFTAAGGGFVGIHAASDAERDWALYDQLVGARFESHPPGVSGGELRRSAVEDASTAALPEPWRWVDEWYRFDSDPRIGSEVLLTVETPALAPEGGNVEPHPVTWRRKIGSAAAWYTALGHLPEAYADNHFREHLLGGLQTATGGER